LKNKTNHTKKKISKKERKGRKSSEQQRPHLHHSRTHTLELRPLAPHAHERERERKREIERGEEDRERREEERKRERGEAARERSREKSGWGGRRGHAQPRRHPFSHLVVRKLSLYPRPSTWRPAQHANALASHHT